MFSDVDDESFHPVVIGSHVPETSNQEETPRLVNKHLQVSDSSSNVKFSTPIARLCNETMPDSQSPIGFLSPDFWCDSEYKKRKRDESVFEITKNDVFSHRIRINEENEMSPVSPVVKSDEKRPKLIHRDFSVFIKDSTNQKINEKEKDDDVAVIENIFEDAEVVDLTLSQDMKTLLKTPTSKKMTTPKSDRSSSKKKYRSSTGWLNKYSPVVLSLKTPKTPKNRRKKLFIESTSTETNNIPLSPVDLFE